MLTSSTPSLPGETRTPSAALSTPACQGRGGVLSSAPPPDPTHTTATGGGATLSFVRGWHEGIVASARLITDPADRCAYLEAQLARLGLELEAPCRAP